MESGSHPSAVSVLRPRRVTRPGLPANFKECDLPLFARALERPMPPMELLELRRVRVSSDGFLYKGLRVLPVSFAIHWRRKRWKPRLLLTNYLLRRRTRIRERAA